MEMAAAKQDVQKSHMELAGKDKHMNDSYGRLTMAEEN